MTNWLSRNPPTHRRKRGRVEHRRIIIRIIRVTVCVLGFLFSFVLTAYLFGDAPKIFPFVLACGCGYVWYLVYSECRDRKPDGLY